MGPLGRKLRTLRRTLRLAGRARALVLLYHRVAELPADPQLLAVAPARFAEHLEVLKQRFTIVSLSGLARAAAARKVPPRAVAITFDDGYADNLGAAAPALARADATATVYVSTGTLGTAREFWWDDLERLLLWTPRLPPRLELAVAGRPHALDTAGPGYGEAPPDLRRWSVLEPPRTPRQRAYAEVARLLHPLPPRERDGAVDAIRAWAGAPADGRASHRPLGREEVRALADAGAVELGAHTVNHARLSSLDAAAQRAEIVEGKARLEELAGRRIATFSYPYGYRESYGPETLGIVREAGFENACSNFAGVVLARTDPFQLPRFVVRDWDGDELARRLEGFHATGLEAA